MNKKKDEKLNLVARKRKKNLIVAALVVFIIVNNYNMNIDETIVRYIFIFLACLTLPHMIFNMKYGEK